MDPNAKVYSPEELVARAAAKEERRKAYVAKPNAKQRTRVRHPQPTPEEMEVARLKRKARFEKFVQRKYAVGARNAVGALCAMADQCKMTDAEFRLLAGVFAVKLQTMDRSVPFVDRVLAEALATASAKIEELNKPVEAT